MIVRCLKFPHRAALVFHVLACVALLLLAVVREPIAGAAAYIGFQIFTKILNIPIYSITLVSVRPEHRGKFFHLLSIKPLTFGASAFVGGFIVDAYGYQTAVAITGISLLMLATPLLLLVGCVS